MKHRIRLRGINGDIEGKVWESDQVLRAGRLGTLEIVLDDHSVSRRHAEVRGTTPKAGRSATWAAPTAPSSTASASAPWKNPCTLATSSSSASWLLPSSWWTTSGDDSTPTPGENLLVEAATKILLGRCDAGFGPGPQPLSPPRRATAGVAAGRPSPGPHRKRRRTAAFHPQRRGGRARCPARRHRPGRGAEPTRSSCGPWPPASGARSPGRFSFSQNLAQRSFSRGESILCTQVGDDPELASAQSIADGAMASVLCVLLRTPRRQLGVLHLDRSYWQKPFTKDDLHLADALAANVSAGIECAQLAAQAARPVLPDHHHSGPGRRAARHLHRRPYGPRHQLLDAAGPEARLAAGRPRPDPHRHAPARHRQDRHRRRHLAQAGQADAGGIRDHEDAHRQGRDHPGDGAGPGPGDPDRALAPRALGRPGLPRQAARREASTTWPASSPSPTPSTP